MVGLCLIRRRCLAAAEKTITITTTTTTTTTISSFLFRGDPFSPVTRPRFAHGSITLRRLLRHRRWWWCRRLPITRFRILYPAWDSSLVLEEEEDFPPDSTTTFRRGSRARRSTTASPTSRPLLPPILAIDPFPKERHRNFLKGCVQLSALNYARFRKQKLWSTCFNQIFSAGLVQLH